jgi:NAD(P)-dependent dehydrogenase (short-subunit alcohol dehydrogenase family)
MAIQNPTKTVDGFEQQFGVNHLAHYTLTALLLPTLLDSSTPAFASRLIDITSSGHGFHTVNFPDVNFTDNYNPWTAYGQSKTANIWLANHVDRIFGARGLHANSVHPGAVMTPLAKHLSEEESAAIFAGPMGKKFKAPGQGAATTVWAAVAASLEGKGGLYLADCGLGKPAVNAADIADEGFAPHAFDPEGEAKLWELSGELTGVRVAE